MDPQERNRREWEDPASWRGPLYFGERDTRVIVRKRGGWGWGWTFNLAHAGGRLILAALIAVGLVAMALAIALGGRGA